MRTILIVFAILLVLLTLLGTFGGSIKHTEPYIDTRMVQGEKFNSSGAYAMPQMPQMPRSMDQKHGEMLKKAPFVDSPMESLHMQMSMPTTNDQMMNEPMPHMAGEVEGFYEQVPPVPSDVRKSTESDSEPTGYAQEGFMIEPFEDDNKSSFPASF